MDLFTKMGEELVLMGNEAIKLTKEVSETAKQRAAVVSENSKISDSYRYMGEKLYRKYKGDDEMLAILGDEFCEAFEKIQSSERKIKDARESILKSKGGVVCPVCKAIVAKGSIYCSKCGGAL